MPEAPSIKEALEHYAHEYCEGWCEQDAGCANFDDCGGCLARRALATFQPDGERREAIARAIWEAQHSRIKDPGPVSASLKWRSRTVPDVFWEGYLLDADASLASGFVQNEAGWRDISTAPKDGTPFIGAFWTIRWADSHRKGDVVTCWWQPEFEAFISSCREMSLAPGLTFENGETSQLHSPVIEPVTHWRPLDRPIRSARDGGAET